MNLENTYTSTGLRLLHHTDRLAEIKKGIIRPIELTLAPTDKCNLSCDFCSVQDREGDELDLEDIMKSYKKLKTIGLKSVVLSGGGDPTMYPRINELIESLDHKVIKVSNSEVKLRYAHTDIGMITNGLLLNKIEYRNLQSLKWIRLSMNALDYNTKFPKLDIPENVDVGMSYVWNDKSKDKTLDKIEDIADGYDVKFVRVVPDCLDVVKAEKFKYAMKNKLKDRPKFFWQSKDSKVSEKCYVGYIKPYLAPDGYFYHCTASVLLDRKLQSKFRMGHMSKVYEIWKPPKPLIPSKAGCKEGKCFFSEHNNVITTLLTEPKHKNFA